MHSGFRQFGRRLLDETGEAGKRALYLNICLIALGSLVAILFIAGHASHVLPFPFWDGVSVANFLDQPQDTWSGYMSAILKFVDNEHRPVFPMLFWSLDRALFHGPGVATVVVMFAICLLTSVLLTTMFGDATSSIGLIVLFAAIAALMLSPGHFENFIWWKQLHVFMSCGATVASLLLAADADVPAKSSPDLRVCTSVILALIATFSFGYGLVVWPLLVGHALLARWRAGQWVPLAAGLLIVAVLFLAFPRGIPSSHGSVFDNLMTPGPVLAYAFELFAFIARPVILLVFPEFGVSLLRLLGFILFVVVLSAAIWSYSGDAQDKRRLRACVLVAGFSFANCLLTALSRVTINVPTAPRYLIISAIGIVSIGAIVLVCASAARRPVPSGQTLTAAVSIMFIGLAVSFWPSGYHGWKTYNDRVQRGAIAADLKATGSYPLLYPAGGASELDDQVWPNHVRRAHQAGDLMGFGRQGSDLTDTFSLISGQCPGAIDSVVPGKEGSQLFEVSGWARMGVQGQEPAEFLLFTDRDETVLGVGSVRTNRPDVASHLSRIFAEFDGVQPELAGFSALVRTTGFDGLKVYATHGRNACRLAVSVDGPSR